MNAIQIAPAASGTNPTATFPATPTSGNVIVVVVCNTNALPAAPTGFGVTTWTKDVERQSTGAGHGTAIYRGVTDGTSASGTFSASSGVIAALEISANAALDTTASDNNTGASSVTGTVTPTASADIILIGGIGNQVNVTTGPTNSFTSVYNPGAGTQHAIMYRSVASASGSYSSGVGTGNNYDPWAGGIAVYKAGAAPVVQIPPIARGVSSG